MKIINVRILSCPYIRPNIANVERCIIWTTNKIYDVVRREVTLEIKLIIRKDLERL
jgi:hypothetical protein